jgi:hypothetical protein
MITRKKIRPNRMQTAMIASGVKGASCVGVNRGRLGQQDRQQSEGDAASIVTDANLLTCAGLNTCKEGRNWFVASAVARSPSATSSSTTISSSPRTVQSVRRRRDEALSDLQEKGEDLLGALTPPPVNQRFSEAKTT